MLLCQISGEFVFQQDSSSAYGHDIPAGISNISQGSVATYLRCGGIFDDLYIVSEFKIGQYLVKIWTRVLLSLIHI